MNEFKPGELVDITMRMVRIESINDVGIAQCSLYESNWRPTINLRAAGVEVERVAPEEWPPCHGDLWQDASGRLWAGMQISTEEDDTADAPYVVLVPLVASMRSGGRPCESVLQDYGPMAIAHREPSEDLARLKAVA